ncbi:MAG TPA: hypothetical protein VK601_15135, partial [Kofleriaceae bacterium]|nr:hypothetical protein [Kofleriaceae bacterium]
MIERQLHRQRRARALAEQVAQLHRHQRVQAQLLERPIHRHRRRARQRQHPRDLRAHHLQHQLPA